MKYESLKNICERITDGSHNPPKGIDKSNYLMISSQNVFDDYLDISESNVRYLSKDDFICENKRTNVKEGDVLLTIVGTVGRSCVISNSEIQITLQRSVGLLSPKKNVVNSRYLMYSLISKRQDLNEEAHGIAQKGIYLKQLANIEIPLPSIDQQQSIVSELDLINELISKKKAQLADLESLTMAIFYEMFGDSIDNPKGWEVKQLGEIGTFTRCNGIVKSDFIEKGLPCVHYGQIHTKFGAYVESHLSEIPDNIYSKCKKASKGDLIIAITSEDIEGSCKCTAWLGNYDVAVGAHAAIFHHSQSPIFISYYFKSNGFCTEKAKYARGFKVKEIKPSDIASIPVYLPPMSLQNQFEKQILSIEKQKSIIFNSISDLETLLASRMQYYFD